MLKNALFLAFVLAVISTAFASEEASDTLKKFTLPSITVTSTRAIRGETPVPFSEINYSDFIPTWITHDVFLSFEHKRFTLTLQYLDGKGNQSGKMVDNLNNSIKYRGYSAFAELKLDNNWRIIGRYDFIDPNTEVDNNDEQRLIAGIGYNFGNGNILILDYDRKMFQNSNKSSENNLKLTMQINF